VAFESWGGRPAEPGSPAGSDAGPATESYGTPAQAADAAAGSFHTLGLSAATLAAVDRAGYTMPTPVQAGLIPRALAGVDVLGQAADAVCEGGG
jgi:ATP-dependent RNA helicase DeaD